MSHFSLSHTFFFSPIGGVYSLVEPTAVQGVMQGGETSRPLSSRSLITSVCLSEPPKHAGGQRSSGPFCFDMSFPAGGETDYRTWDAGRGSQRESLQRLDLTPMFTSREAAVSMVTGFIQWQYFDCESGRSMGHGDPEKITKTKKLAVLELS